MKVAISSLTDITQNDMHYETSRCITATINLKLLLWYNSKKGVSNDDTNNHSHLPESFRFGYITDDYLQRV